MDTLNDLDQHMIRVAKQVRERAYAPYSNYKVGAALACRSGDVVVGCNVENRSFGATLCAERNAISQAVGMGQVDFERLVVVTEGDPPATPCGICLQVLSEFCDDLPILLVNPQGRIHRTNLKNLLPAPFRFA